MLKKSYSGISLDNNNNNFQFTKCFVNLFRLTLVTKIYICIINSNFQIMKIKLIIIILIKKIELKIFTSEKKSRDVFTKKNLKRF